MTDVTAFLAERATALQVPGAAVGIYHDGAEHYAFHGVTSVENPLPVDASTLFQFGSTGKTYTATLLMLLVDRGRLDLDAPVRRYLPELVLADESVAEAVTVRQLTNHTAGWSGDFELNTGTGDDALARYVAAMADNAQVTPLGTEVSYNNASFSLAGRVIEKITGMTFEAAMTELILKPAGLNDTWFFPTDIMTRRFAAGHHLLADGTVAVARPWAMPRSGNPAGGMSSTVADQIAWARLHLADGRAADGTQLMDAELIRSMRRPTVEVPGHALGDAIGIAWMLREVGGVTTVGHGGTTIGQHSAFVTVPERDFAVTVLTNCGPNGEQLNTEVVDWALETFLGVVEAEPDYIPTTPRLLAGYSGHYDDIAMTADITVDGERLSTWLTVKESMLAEIGGVDPYTEPVPLGLLADDRYVVPDGALAGMRGFFERDGDDVVAIQLGGRRFARIGEARPR